MAREFLNKGAIIMPKESAIFLPVKAQKLVAKVTQSGIDAPAFGTQSENTLSATPTWARTSAGIYTLTLVGAFTAGKTFAQIISSNAAARIFEVIYTSVDVITINCFDAATPTAADSGDFDIEIAVFS